jgi:hypothetical protein
VGVTNIKWNSPFQRYYQVSFSKWQSESVENLTTSKGYNPNLFPMSMINRQPSRLYRHSVGKSTPFARDGVRFKSLSFEKYHLTMVVIIIFTQRGVLSLNFCQKSTKYELIFQHMFNIWRPYLVTRTLSTLDDRAVARGGKFWKFLRFTPRVVACNLLTSHNNQYYILILQSISQFIYWYYSQSEV